MSASGSVLTTSGPASPAVPPRFPAASPASPAPHDNAPSVRPHGRIEGARFYASTRRSASTHPTTSTRRHSRHPHVLCPPVSGPPPHRHDTQPITRRTSPHEQGPGIGSTQPRGVRISQSLMAGSVRRRWDRPTALDSGMCSDCAQLA